MANANTDDFDLDTGDYIRLTSTQQSAKLIHTRMGDLIADLKRRRKGVQRACCPVHGENLVLRKKRNSNGVMDSYFLACPWRRQEDDGRTDDLGCNFVDKLKSPAQISSLLKSETGQSLLA
jgi:ribosome recycling factor